MNNVYSWVRDSLFAYSLQFITDMQTTYPSNPVLTQYNFDAFAEQNLLPAADFVGIRGLTLDISSELATMNCMYGLSTNDDENLFRLEDLSGQLLNRLLPKRRIAIYESGTSTQRGWMVLSDGTSVSPVLRASQRPLRFIAISGGMSLAFQP